MEAIIIMVEQLHRSKTGVTTVLDAITNKGILLDPQEMSALITQTTEPFRMQEIITLEMVVEIMDGLKKKLFNFVSSI